MDFGNITISDVKLKIAIAVKALRKRENLSQEELAALLAVSRITIQNLEAGKNFTIDTLLKVLQHFDLLTDLNAQIDETIEVNKKIISLY
jgi:transcriptional regulator with XRE-family HTH domain